jgi:hypothetical protein
MRIRLAAVLTVGALVSIGCKGSGSSGDAMPAAPTAPSVPAAQPPAVNVGGVSWTGQASSDQGSSGTLQLNLQQTGAQVTGTIFHLLSQSGPFVGTVSGSTISFNFSVGNSGAGCGNAISGTATVSSVNQMITPPNATSTISGTFSGKDCTGNPVTNGTFTTSLDGFSATRFPIAGTWTGFLPPPLGGGGWTWTLAQNGDVNGGNLTGSVTVANNTLNLGTGPVTGTYTNVFPGAPSLISAVTNVSFPGACPATLAVTWGNFTGDGLQWVAASFSGSDCNGPFAAFKPLIKRQ